MRARDSKRLASIRAQGWREAIDYAQHIRLIHIADSSRLDRMAKMILRTGLSWEELQFKNLEETRTRG